MIASVKGTRDLLPPETRVWNRVEAFAREVFALYGFDEIRTPVLESTELFVRSVGESSDIVHKEMYTFTDRGDRSVTLRPENTAGVARAYVEHGLSQAGRPWKLYYMGPQFRYERPQKGRYREFRQIGAEVLGDPTALIDAEAVSYTHLRAHETRHDLVCRLLLEKKKKTKQKNIKLIKKS